MASNVRSARPSFEMSVLPTVESPVGKAPIVSKQLGITIIYLM
jgi:hypothetical protein